MTASFAMASWVISAKIVVPKGRSRVARGEGDEAAMRIIDSLLDNFVHDLRDTNQKLDKIFSRPDRTLEQLKLLMQPTQAL